MWTDKGSWSGVENVPDGLLPRSLERGSRELLNPCRPRTPRVAHQLALAGTWKKAVFESPKVFTWWGARCLSRGRNSRYCAKFFWRRDLYGPVWHVSPHERRDHRGAEWGKRAMLREETRRCAVTILAQEVSAPSNLHERHRFGADLLFLFLWRIMRRCVNSLHGERLRTCSAATFALRHHASSRLTSGTWDLWVRGHRSALFISTDLGKNMWSQDASQRR